MENEFLIEGTSASKVKLDEVRQIEELTPVTKSEQDLIRSNSKPNIEPSLRRSSRVPHQTNRYFNFLVRDGDTVELDENNKDPIIYMDVI